MRTNETHEPEHIKAEANNMSGKLVFYTNTGAALETERMRIDNDGNVGICTSTPSAKLNVHLVSPSGNAFHLSSGNSSSNTANIFQVDANSGLANALVVQRDGNVGIGNGKPSAKLQVAGDVGLGNGTVAGEGVITVFLTNNTGAVSVKGQIVIIYGDANNAFDITATASNNSVIGVVYEAGISTGQPCRNTISVTASVIADATIYRGQHCVTGSGTAGRAASIATPGAETSIGVWLEKVSEVQQGKYY
jgi:hypothetical protein